VHVLWSGRLGGIERLVHDLASEQSRLGLQVAAAFGQAGGFFADRIRALGLTVIDLKLHSGHDLGRRISAGARLLAPYDLIHAHGYNVPLGRIMSRSRGAIVFTEHGQFGLGRRLGISGTLKQRLQRRFMSNRCAALAANSRWTAGLVSRTYGIDADRVTVVHNGIALAPEPSIEIRGDSADEVVVAFVGQLKAFKRVDRLIRAAALVRQPDRVRVLIAGSGPLEGPMRKLAQEQRVAGRIDFLGWTPDVTAVLRQADVIVLPSEGEPFGLAMVEGCAEGLLPIAFSDGGGALECMPPDGRVVASVGELADVLEQIRGSEGLSLEARRARSVWARESFPIARTAAAYHELYQSALGATLTSSR
jgi:glycosyltransferase involved in cell wall biosynthesis